MLKQFQFIYTLNQLFRCGEPILKQPYSVQTFKLINDAFVVDVLLFDGTESTRRKKKMFSYDIELKMRKNESQSEKESEKKCYKSFSLLNIFILLTCLFVRARQHSIYSISKPCSFFWRCGFLFHTANWLQITREMKKTTATRCVHMPNEKKSCIFSSFIP